MILHRHSHRCLLSPARTSFEIGHKRNGSQREPYVLRESSCVCRIKSGIPIIKINERVCVSGREGTHTHAKTRRGIIILEIVRKGKVF